MSKLRHFKKKTSSVHLLTPDELQISVNKSAEHLRVLWISYSLFAVYLIITSLSVTHRHLFLELPLRLPVLNIDLGLQDFFIAAPILFIGMHLYLVFHVNVLRQQIVKYQAIVRTETALQEKKSYLFDPFVFLQSWVGHAKGLRSKIGFAIITHGSLKVFPIFVLLLIMLSALPYHDEKLTHYHRIMVVLDFVVIAVFAVNWRKGVWHLLCRILMTLMAFTGLFISLYGILVFQGEMLYSIQCPILKSATQSLLEGKTNYITGKPESLFSNRLILVNEDSVDNKLLEELDEKEAKNDFPYKIILRKRGRHFENAVFDFSDLRRTDFTGAYISNASFFKSNLEKSNFSCGKLPDGDNDNQNKESSQEKCRTIEHKDVNFKEANLKKSDLSYIQLQGAELISANLQGAKLISTNLQGSNLRFSKLQNTHFQFSSLEGVNFKFAQLQNADLSFTQLQSANFEFSGLQGANLKCANLEKAFLKYTNVWNADFNCHVKKTTNNSRSIQTADFIKIKEIIDNYNNGKKQAFLNHLIFEDNHKTAQYWHQHLSEMKERWEENCLKKGKNSEKVCEEDYRKEWFQKFIDSINKGLKEKQEFASQKKQIKKHKKIWQDAQSNSSHKNKDEDEFLKDFWQYRVEKFVCKNKITVDTIITRLNKIPYAYFNVKDQKNFVQTLLKQIDDGNCPLNPALTHEQRVTLEGWLKVSD